MRNLSQYLTRRPHPTHGEIVCLSDDAPQWAQDAVHEAHGDLMPDNWRYKMIEFIADAIDEQDDDDPDIHEIADRFVDNHCYYHQRLDWLSSNLCRMGYCNEAQDEGLVAADANMDQRIAIGMYQECAETAGLLLQALTVDDDEEE